jgi:hypothetical protein
MSQPDTFDPNQDPDEPDAQPTPGDEQRPAEPDRVNR